MDESSYIYIISVSYQGRQLSEILWTKLRSRHTCVQAYTVEAYKTDSIPALPLPLRTSLQGLWRQAKAIIFIGAVGIAVRTIAPYIQHKAKDPAILCLDEKGKFVIPLLSGHMGGANALAVQISRVLRSTPVLTTATDIHGLFAVDTWAMQQGLCLQSFTIAKKFSAYLLQRRQAGFFSEFAEMPGRPSCLMSATKESVGMAVTIHASCRPFPTTLAVYPPILHLGIGCRRGVLYEDLEAAVLDTLKKYDLAVGAIRDIRTVDIKLEEPGLCALASARKWPLHGYSVKQLQAVEGSITSSAFVQRIVGVDNVCERAALVHLKNGILRVRKQRYKGITIAIGQENFTVSWERRDHRQ